MAYRLFLGREPENQDVVIALQQNIHTYEDLRKNFLNSHEFLQKASEFIGEQQNVRLRHPLLPSIPVELEVSDEDLPKMLDRIHNEWEALGKNNPYWSVLTQDQFGKSKFENNRSEFFSSGKYPVDAFLASLRRNKINPNTLESCIDVGCGVGRVTRFLAPAFKKVIGLDISQPHLEIAKEYLAAEGITNVELIHSGRLEVFDNLPMVDAIYSIIVLQHNSPPIMVRMMKALFKALKPKGVAYLQIPTYRNGYLFEVKRYLNSIPPDTLEMHFLPQDEIFKLIEESGCICLEVREDGMVAEDHFTLSHTFLIQKK